MTQANKPGEPLVFGSGDQLSHVVVPERVQEALAVLLERQFALGMLAATGRRPTTAQCTPAADSVQLVCDSIRDALRVSAETERKKLEMLMRRSRVQLRKWSEWYGSADHSARGQLPLPPAGDVELAEDISAALGLNVGGERTPTAPAVGGPLDR